MRSSKRLASARRSHGARNSLDPFPGGRSSVARSWVGRPSSRRQALARPPHSPAIDFAPLPYRKVRQGHSRSSRRARRQTSIRTPLTTPAQVLPCMGCSRG